MLTKLKLAMLISAPLVAGATTLAVAQGSGADPRPMRPMMEKFDQNGDGQLDDAERAQRKAAFEAKHAQRKAEMLSRFDANRDGELDDAERRAMHEAKLAARFQKLDANGDGVLSIDEFKADAGKRGFRHHGRRGHGRHHRGGGMTP